MFGVVWQRRRKLGLVKLVRSLLEMSEFVCHLLEHRSIIVRPLEFVRVVTSRIVGRLWGKRVAVGGSRRGEHSGAKKWYTVSVGEFSDCAIVLGWFGHLRGG